MEKKKRFKKMNKASKRLTKNKTLKSVKVSERKEEEGFAKEIMAKNFPKCKSTEPRSSRQNLKQDKTK